MGFFSFIGDIVQTIIVKPSNVVTKAVIGVEIFKKPGEAFAKGIGVPLLGAGLFKTAAITTAVLGGQFTTPPTQQQTSIFNQQAAAQRAPPTGTPRASVSGSAAAFSQFGLGQLGGGNPAWHSSGLSVTRSAVSVVSSARSSAQWVRSGNSVRRLA